MAGRSAAHPDHIDKTVGPQTRIIGLTENDPLGLGPATSTFAQVWVEKAT
jgi:hypothetical protein